MSLTLIGNDETIRQVVSFRDFVAGRPPDSVIGSVIIKLIWWEPVQSVKPPPFAFSDLPVPHFLPERLNIISDLLGRLAKPEPSSLFDEHFFGSHEWILAEGVKAVKM